MPADAFAVLARAVQRGSAVMAWPDAPRPQWARGERGDGGGGTSAAHAREGHAAAANGRGAGARRDGVGGGKRPRGAGGAASGDDDDGGGGGDGGGGVELAGDGRARVDAAPRSTVASRGARHARDETADGRALACIKRAREGSAQRNALPAAARGTKRARDGPVPATQRHVRQHVATKRGRDMSDACRRVQEQRDAKRSRAVTVHMPADRYDAGSLPRTADAAVAGNGASDASSLRLE